MGFDQTNPLDLPTTAKVVIEQAANYQFYWERPIVGKGDLENPPEEQFGPYTSELAKALGYRFKMSPARIEHAIRGVFGGVGTDVTDGLSILLEETKLLPKTGTDREKELSDLPIIGRAFARGGVGGLPTETVDKFYDLLDHHTERSRSSYHPETELEREQRLLLMDAGRSLSVLRMIYHSSAKRADRNAIKKIMDGIAEDAVSAVRNSKDEFDVQSYRPDFSDTRKLLEEAREDAEEFDIPIELPAELE